MATRKKTARKKTTAKKSTAKKTTRKKSTAKKSPAKKKSTRKYSKKAGQKVRKVMEEFAGGKLTSGRSGKKVTSRKQAIAIGLSEARAEGDKMPPAPKRKRS